MRAAAQYGQLSPASFDDLAERVYASAHQALDGNDTRTAERFFGLLVLLAPKDERGWVGLGLASERRAEFSMAASRYLLGSAVVPSSVRCHLGRGRALRQLGRLAEADQAFDEAEESAAGLEQRRLVERERSAS